MLLFWLMMSRRRRVQGVPTKDQEVTRENREREREQVTGDQRHKDRLVNERVYSHVYIKKGTLAPQVYTM